MTTTGSDQRLLVQPAGDIAEFNAHNVRVRPIFRRDTAGFESSFSFVLYNRLPAGEVNERHMHDDVEKVYYFLKGKAELACGPWTAQAGAGDFVFFPAAIEHQIRSLGPDDLEFVVCAAQTLGPPRGLKEEA